MIRHTPLLAGVIAACAAGAQSGPPAPAPRSATPTAAADVAPTVDPAVPRQPFLPPLAAFRAGLMPLRATGVTEFQSAHPTYDGRGVLIAILDSGIDPGTYGLITTTTGGPKILDLRDFSGEGAVTLTAVAPAADGSVTVGGRRLLGARRIGRLAVGNAWYGGVFGELALGPLPAADVNGNGTNTDAFPLVVARATDGWVVFLDSNLDGSFEDEMPLHDYRQGRETMALGRRPLTLAANLVEVGGVPRLDLYFDTKGHGTFVAGVAAGHNLFNVPGFHGVAPGAQLLGLKIANDARGGISVTGSFVRAMDYAVRFAAERNLALVLNLSFGVGNEQEGRATIDSVVDAFLDAHPDVVFTISAGNDGPGISTLGFPGSAHRALTVGSIFPGVFARPEAGGVGAAADVMGWWSSRGGELVKPDLVAPGVAFSAVPPWDTGNEVKVGTSFSAPHAAGLAACLLAAMAQERHPVSAIDVIQALRNSATPLPGATVLDQGAGLPRLEAAWRWLTAGHQGSRYIAAADSAAPALLWRDGARGTGDTLVWFGVRHVGGLRAGRFQLRSDASWLAVNDTATAQPGKTDIPVRYRRDALRAPGLYVGTVVGRDMNDTLAGALFRLVTTVVVSHDLTVGRLAEPRRTIAPGRVERWFLRAPVAGATLHLTVVLADSLSGGASVSVFEPSGRPLPGMSDGVQLGGGTGTAHVVVAAQDLVPGVYELDVVAPALAAATVSVRAELAPVALAATAGGTAVEISNPGEAGVSVTVSQRMVGAERVFAVAGRGAPAESLTVVVPGWARSAELDVVVDPALWSALTDLGVSVWDSAGQQVLQEPQDYARGRARVELDATRLGRPLTLELFPAFALPAATRPWSATVTVRFLLAGPVAVGPPQQVPLVAAGRAIVTVAAAAMPALPEGFVPLIEVEAGGSAAAGVLRVRRSSP